MKEEFMPGDTINLININGDEEHRETKGFLININFWGGSDKYGTETNNKSFVVIDNKNSRSIRHVGDSYFSMKVCTCRMVLIEKSIPWNIDFSIGGEDFGDWMYVQCK